MRKFIIAAAVVLAPISPLMAHGNHDEEEQDRPIQQVAKDNVIKLITKGTLPASWSKAKFVETNSRTVQGARQDVVIFRNDAEPEARKLLYVALKPDGAFVSANHKLK